MIFNKFCNRFINKITNILIILILILIAFFIGLNTAHAVEVVPWLNSENSPYDDIPTLNSITFKSGWTYSDYNSDNTKQLVFDISNEKYFDNSMNIEDFYSNYNYVVYSFGESTIRVLVQDYSLMLENQGLNPISGNQTKFFLYNVGIFYKQSSTLYYHNGVGAFYNWIIDISYNSDSYVVTDDGNRLDIKYMSLKSQNGYDTINRNLNNIRLFDSYNGNLAWVESFNPLIMPTGFEALDISPPNYTYVTVGPYYYFNVFDIPELEFVSSGVPLPDEPGDDSPSDYFDILDTIEDWLSKIEGNTNESKGFLEGIGETLGKIGQSIGDGLNDLIEGISGTLDDINDWFTGGFNDLVEGISGTLDDIYDWFTGGFNNLLEGISGILDDLFNSVFDFFADFFDKLIDALIGLIVPDDLDSVKELYESIKSKLGFIVEVPELLITFMFDLINADWEKVTSLKFPSINVFGYNFWDEKEIDLMPIINIIQPYKIYTDIACVGLMIIGCINLYEKFTGGDN